MKTQNKNYFEEQQSVRGDNIKELLRKQDEFHSSMTMLQQNINKVDEDGKDRSSLVREELRVIEAALTSSFSDLENKIAVDDSTLQQRVQIAFDKTNGKFTEQFDSMVLDHKK